MWNRIFASFNMVNINSYFQSRSVWFEMEWEIQLNLVIDIVNRKNWLNKVSGQKQAFKGANTQIINAFKKDCTVTIKAFVAI